MRRVAPFAAIKGMNRDLAASKFSSEFAYEIKNMRIMPDKSNTLMALVNEKGNKQARLKIWDWVDAAKATDDNQEPDPVWEFKPITDNDGEYVYQDSIQGTPIGQAVINNTLVLFTNDNGTNWIYKIWADSEKEVLNIFPLFSGDLGMDEYNPAETIVFYENEELQKVYWVDGKNQPRLINIADNKDSYDKWLNTKGDSFNFIRKINFIPNGSTAVTVKRDIVSNGIFSAGVIQYVFTYMNQYMQETSPFHTSALYYTSYSDRGGNPEETVSNSFTIGIEHPDTDFEYVRIYSILRTSLEAEATCKLIAELAVDGVDEEDKLTYVDTGTTGSIIDPTELLYVGGEEIVAGTLEQKDNTLFLGDLKLTRRYITQLLDITPQTVDKFGKEEIASEEVTIPIEFEADKEFEYPDSNNSYYPYSNSLSKSSQEIKTFKYRESYRFGIQAQYETGKWSEAVWIGDFTNSLHPTYKGSVFADGNINLVQAKAVIPQEILKTLKTNGYVKIRPVIVYPDLSSRACICQGVLCPTVFNVSDRYENGPYAQASWFVRPNAPMTVGDTSEDGYASQMDNDTDVQYGAYAEFRDLHPLPSCEHRNCEIQCLRNVPPSPYLPENIISKPTVDDAIDFISEYQEHFFVDQSIVTLHSPDVEFDDDVKVFDLSQLSMRIVGIVPLTAYNSAIDIQTSTPALSPSEHSHSHKDLIKGFYSEPISVPHDFDNGGSNHAWKARISGIWWLDYNIDKDCGTEHWYNNGRRDDVLWGYAVYPWHRNGSLNNQSSQDTNGYRTAMLDRKKISNSRTSYKTWFFDVDDEKEYEVSGATLWNSNEQTLVRIPSPCSGVVPDINYYGNIDKVITVTRKLTTASTDELDKHKTQAVDEDGKLVYEVDENGDRIVDSNGNYIPVYETDEEGNIYEEYNDDNDFDSSSGYPIIISVNYNTRWSCCDDLEWGNGGDVTKVNKLHNMVSDHDIYTGEYIDIGTGINSDESSTIKLKPDGEDTINSESPLYGSDPIRMKYKSTPHVVMALSYKGNDRVVLPTVRIEGKNALNSVSGNNGYPFWSYKDSVTTEMENIGFKEDENAGYGWLWLGELYRDKVESRFGGKTPEAMESNTWLPCGEAVDIDALLNDSDRKLIWSEGDTYYMRYDHIKTYPYTLEDQNSITDIISFLCETRVNLDGRYDRNRGQVDNLSITPENFNIMNAVYNQTNDFFAYTTINGNKINLDNFRNVITWTKTKTAGDLVDTWTNITVASTLDLDGDKGNVNKLKRFNNELLAFQDTGISQILYNETMQIASTEGVPIEIANSGKVQGKRYLANQAGCINKWSMCETPAGLYFIDDINKTMYLFNGQFGKLSEQLGFTSWINSQLGSMEAWNPVDFNNFVTYYDKCNHDIYFINKDYCLAFSESLGQFTSFYDYNAVPYFANLQDRGIWIGRSHSDTLTEHEYKLWLHNEGEYNSYFNETMPYWLTVVANPEMQMDKIFDNIEFRSDTYSDDLGLLHSRTFDTLRAYNEYQDTGEVSLRNIWAKPSSTSNLKKKFRIWRAIIPRDKNGNGRNRIRNPWTYLTLKTNDPQNYKTILHDLMVYYFDGLPSSSNNGNSNEE